MVSDRPKVGTAFRSSPDRTEGLSGLLASSPSEPATEKPPASDPGAEPENSPGPAPTPARDSEAASGQAHTARDSAPPASPRRRGRRSGQRNSRSAAPTTAADGPASPEDVPRVVPVVLDAPILEGLREESRRSGRTHGLIALGAIENHVEVLENRWSTESSSSPRGGLFGRTQPQHRRSEPGVQTQLRLAVGDADVLEDLVATWSAPSRSALVNEALGLELGDAGPREGDR